MQAGPRRLLCHAVQATAAPVILFSTYGTWSGISHHHPGSLMTNTLILCCAASVLWLGGRPLRAAQGSSAQRNP